MRGHLARSDDAHNNTACPHTRASAPLHDLFPSVSPSLPLSLSLSLPLSLPPCLPASLAVSLTTIPMRLSTTRVRGIWRSRYVYKR